MNEHTTHPRSARRHPRALFGQMQVYAQNNPRAYAVRVMSAVLLMALLPPLVLCVILLDDWTAFVPVLLGAAAPAVVIGALMVWLMPKFLRRTLGTSTLHPDTDPVDLLEAKRQLRRGGLHERDEVNRIARVVAAQAEAKINSPKTVNVLSAVGLVMFGALTIMNYLLSGMDFDFFFTATFTLLFVAYLLFLGPWTKRYRQRARDFARLYDERAAVKEEAPGTVGG
ncbi:hypothetical protein [Nocardiopsis sp. B62]|uniref:hypothetical protein n=1 Tax=Nocardiopsis sp. B62 TaxID=2824874 RepID=UPI001B377A11|nr:hypothetical protein [Nocardiopsis sp. B62]MBQ1082164.1 hypothetical protein [Nocardiopsis sp. B62]